MAKHKISSKNFFTISVLSVTALMLLVFTFALQKPTNTQSDASGSCLTPAFTKSGTDTGRNSVVYTYTAKNPISSGCKLIEYGVYVSQKPSKWWTVEYKLNDDTTWSNPLYSIGRLKPGQTNIHKIKVTPPPKAESRPYDLKVKACEAFQLEIGGGYELTKNCVTRTIQYTVD